VIEDNGSNACDLKENLMDENKSTWTLIESSHLIGHAARLCRVVFHPRQKHVATTSFDHSWRLWDIETGQTSGGGLHSQQREILLQDGHCREVYGIGFHPDGSLCATTDFSGVVQIWDLRTGKSIRHFLGHARRVLNAEFHPINGFQLATAGDDGTIRIWDLRGRKQFASIPAHSNLITGLRFETVSGEYLASSSFDGTIKLWNTRDWKMLNQLEGHEGQISGVDILGNNTLVSCGFDKTLKMWR
jgi:U4/U6 small nuclear ribonucleoprotein PRP4